jgi:predicted peptidase
MEQIARSFERRISKSVGCQYWLATPGDAPRPGEPWPMLLFLHGAGERGEDLNLVRAHGPPRLVARGRDLPFLLVSPQCPTDRWWDNDVLAALLEDVIANHPVDTDRIYLTGISMGGFGTWSLATAYPQRFAAIIPICGGGSPYLADRLKSVPVWAFHGAQDEVVPLYESQRMVDAVLKSGGRARLTIYPEAAHDAWTQTYANPEIYAWLLKHRRSETR